jgi:hypothetical protein
MTWNSTLLIKVLTFVDLIEEVKLILNYIITRPLVVLSSIMCLLVRYRAWNYLSPVVKYFKVFILIMTL